MIQLCVMGVPLATLLMLRHAATVWNAERRLQGSIDEPLSDLGRAEAAAWRLPPDAAGRRWFVSPLRRAVETAQILGVEAVREPRLAEMSWGAWEGRRCQDLVQSGDLNVDVNLAGLDFRAPGGESPRDVQERLRPWLSEIGAAGVPVGAVAHNGVIRALYALASDWDMTTRTPEKPRSPRAHLLAVDRSGQISVIKMNITLDQP